MSERKDRKAKRKASWLARLFGKKQKQVPVVPLGTITLIPAEDITPMRSSKSPVVKDHLYSGKSPEDLLLGKRKDWKRHG